MKQRRGQPLWVMSLIVFSALLSYEWLEALDDGWAYGGWTKQIRVTEIEAGARGGFAYRMTYMVPVPIDIFWRFKTDFAGMDPSDSRHIDRHRFIGRRGNRVLTETSFAGLPRASFVWQTIVFEAQYRLGYNLVSTDLPGHRFHYGRIQLRPSEGITEVIQEAYFDFAGATLWYFSPWRGGMRSFLTAVARWEQEKAVELRQKYDPN